MNLEKEYEVKNALADFVIRVARKDDSTLESEKALLPHIAKIVLEDDKTEIVSEKEKDRAFVQGLSLGLGIGALAVSIIALVMQLLR